jgi:plastocyanin
VTDDQFTPGAIQVSPGATVTWTWSGTGNLHNVTFANAAIADSGNQTSGTYDTAMPTATGTYTYQCTNHSGMDGSVLVQ